MTDAAHAESLDHDVFRRPFKVEPEFEYWATPQSYHSMHVGKDKLPEKMKVWRVQNMGNIPGRVPIPGGSVAPAHGFTDDSPDAEALALGYNIGKEYGAVGVGRHGSFLQWGYSAPPSQMTEAGRKFFLNCVCYIHGFDDKGPLVRTNGSHRMNAFRLAAYYKNRIVPKIFEDREYYFKKWFASGLWEKYGSDPNGLIEYYRENLDLVYRDGGFRVDNELKSLGLKSNRSLETLERLIALQRDDAHAKTARRLLSRYTDEWFDSAGQWQRWFRKNKSRFFFSDVGGYKFFVAPKGYLDKK